MRDDLKASPPIDDELEALHLEAYVPWERSRAVRSLAELDSLEATILVAPLRSHQRAAAEEAFRDGRLVVLEPLESAAVA